MKESQFEIHKNPDVRGALLLELSELHSELGLMGKSVEDGSSEQVKIQEVMARYMQQLRGNVETITGTGNAQVYLEVAGLLHESGFIDEAITTLTGTGMDDITSIAYEVFMLGNKELYQKIWDTVYDWEDELLEV